jgi:capsule polysaccharide export protein KpsE/RkpR
VRERSYASEKQDRLTPKNPVHVVGRPIEHGPDFAEPAIRTHDSRRVEWLRMLWQERRFLGRACVAGLVLSLLAAILIPARYESKTRLMPPDQQSGSGLAMLAALAGKGSSSGSAGGVAGALGGGLGSMAGDLLGLKSSGALFVDMLAGPTIQDQLIRKFDLRKVYSDKYFEQARKDLEKRTSVKEDRKSGVITITVTDHDPHRAQAMAQAYVDALNGLVAQVSTSSARRERIFIEGRLNTVKQNLDAALKAFSDYASKNGTLDVPEQTKAMVQSEGALQGQLIAAQSELEGLKQIYTDNNIRVRTLEARVSALKHQVEAMSGNKADLSSDESQIAGDFPSIRKLPLLGVQWANLYRESKVQETVYELLTQEYEFAKIQEAKEIPSVNLLDAPLLPERSSFPPRILITLLGSVLAGVLAGIFLIGSSSWRQSDSPEKHLVTEVWEQMKSNQSQSSGFRNLFGKFKGRNGSDGRAA